MSNPTPETAAQRFARDHGSQPTDRQTDEYKDRDDERQDREYVDSATNTSAEDSGSNDV